MIVLQGLLVDYVRERAPFFAYNVLTAWGNGLLISLMFYVKFRETRAAAALHRAEAERHLLSKQAIEAELKLMQAQVEPHFLFNTLASVQYLTETDPPQAGRAARPPDRLPARGAAAAARALDDAGQGGRAGARRTSGSCGCASGRGSRSRSTCPPTLRDAAVSAEPADLAGRERDQARHRAGGRRRHASIDARRDGDDAGRHGRRHRSRTRPAGARPPARASGLTNMRERLAALYGARGRFTLRARRRRAACARRCRLPFETPSLATPLPTRA